MSPVMTVVFERIFLAVIHFYFKFNLIRLVYDWPANCVPLGYILLQNFIYFHRLFSHPPRNQNYYHFICEGPGARGAMEVVLLSSGNRVPSTERHQYGVTFIQVINQ